MELFVTGLDESIEPELFRALQNLSEEAILHFYDLIARGFKGSFVLLLTCDRAEVISEGSAISHEALEHILGLNPLRCKKYRYSISSLDETVRHIFTLATGIISPLFGESTIIGQLATACECAHLRGTLSSSLSRLFLMAISFGKRVHTSINFDRADREVIDEVIRRTVERDNFLIIGSSEDARLLASLLVKSGKNVVETLRDKEKLFLISPGVKAIGYEERYAYIANSDVIISATKGLYETFEASDAVLFKDKLLFDIARVRDLPLSFNAIRAEDLGVRRESRELIIKEVRVRVEAESLAYKRELEKRDSCLVAEDLGQEVLRRFSSTIKALELEGERERNLRKELAETVRKAYMTVLFRKQ